MYNKTLCCYFDPDYSEEKADRMFKEFWAKVVDEYIATGKPYTLVNLRDATSTDLDIVSIREAYVSMYPFRIRYCPSKAMTCCGCCTQVCPSRCVMDCLTKLGMHLASKHQDGLRIEVQRLLTDKNTTYKRLLFVVNELISVRRNKRLADNMRERYGDDTKLKCEENPWRFNYSPDMQMYVSPKTGKLRRKVDLNTGIIQFYDYPKSGLCPYCMPKVTIDKSKLPRQKESL